MLELELEAKLELATSTEALWQLFEEVGMDFYAVNNRGESLLHVLVEGRAGHALELFKMLVERKGLDPLLEDYRQRTPLDVAAAVGAKEVLGLFKGEGDRGTGGRETG